MGGVLKHYFIGYKVTKVSTKLCEWNYRFMNMQAIRKDISAPHLQRHT